HAAPRRHGARGRRGGRRRAEREPARALPRQRPEQARSRRSGEPAHGHAHPRGAGPKRRQGARRSCQVPGAGPGADAARQRRARLAAVDLHGPPAAVPNAPVSGAIDAGEAGDSSEADAGSREINETLTPGAPATAEERDRPEPPVEHDAGEPPREPEMSAEAPLSPTEPFSEDGAHAVLENGVRAIASEVRNSLDFYRTQEGGGDVSRVVLSGSALELPGF